MTRSRIFIIVLSVLALLLFLRLWFGAGSFPRVWELQRQIDELSAANQEQQETNRKVLAEIEEFRNGDDAVEERARSDFGMVKKGETFYQVILQPDEEQPQAPPQQPAESAAQ